MTEYRTGIQTSQTPPSRELSAAVGIASALLAVALILAGIAGFAGVRALYAHRDASLELNTTLRQVYLRHELAIAEFEHREPRLRESESPLPE